jgi:hypothetical protein
MFLRLVFTQFVLTPRGYAAPPGVRQERYAG